MRTITCLSLVLILTILNTGADGSRILGIFPSPVRSHFVMFESLVKGLAEKGHQVDVISYFSQSKQMRNIKEISIRDGLPAKQNNVTYEKATGRMSSRHWVKDVAQDVGHSYCDLLKHPAMQNVINISPQDVPYDLVITELFFSPCYFAFGRHLKVPIIAISSNALFDFMNDPFGNPINPAFVPSSLVTYSQKMNFGERLWNTFFTFYMKNSFNQHIRAQDEYVEKYFGPGYPTVYELQKDVALVLVNSHFILNGIRPMTPAVVEVGGLHIQDEEKKLPEEIQKWLDESEHGCIYVSFGSMVTFESFPENLIHSFYTTFENIAPVRVLMKVVNEQELPPGLPDNVKTSAWFSQLQVLKHKNIKAFVTHGGLMGSQEAIYCGVPMIGIPFYGDQRTNVYRFERLKIAIAIDHLTITPESLTTAVKAVITDPSYRNNVKEISRLFMDRPISSMETAIFWVEYIIRNGGDSLKSPATDLAWWQVELLDVYVIIPICFVMCSYILYSIITTVIFLPEIIYRAFRVW